VFLSKKEDKKVKIGGLRARTKASVGHIWPAGRMLCIPDLCHVISEFLEFRGEASASTLPGRNHGHHVVSLSKGLYQIGPCVPSLSFRYNRLIVIIFAYFNCENNRDIRFVLIVNFHNRFVKALRKKSL